MGYGARIEQLEREVAELKKRLEVLERIHSVQLKELEELRLLDLQRDQGM